jgi:hypothetical protein
MDLPCDGATMPGEKSWCKYPIISTGPRKAAIDGVAKSPPYCVTAFFQDLDIPDVCLRP